MAKSQPIPISLQEHKKCLLRYLLSCHFLLTTVKTSASDCGHCFHVTFYLLSSRILPPINPSKGQEGAFYQHIWNLCELKWTEEVTEGEIGFYSGFEWQTDQEI